MASHQMSTDMTKAVDLETETLQFLTFTVNGSEYGVDIMSVREIKGWTETTRLPNTPPHMRGVMNLRGAIIPIFDLRCRFNLGATEANAKNVVVILVVGDRNIGILVDAVSDIVNAESAEIKAAPEDASTDIDSRFVCGLISKEQRMIVLLNIENLFKGHDLEHAQTITEGARP